MNIVSIYNDRTRYSLTASFDGGALVLSGQDLSPGLEEMFGRDEYEYWYRVDDVPRVCAELGATTDTLFARVKELLASHGISASTRWKEWLIEKQIPYKFSNY
ncbi:MAG TPA: hypothetical protein VGC41_20055 [Kofleriaceae bacterium]